MKRIKTLKACAIICMIMGVSFLFSSVFIYMNAYNFIKNGEETTANIVSITETVSGEDIRYFVEVEYLVNDVKHINELGYYHSGMSEGQTIPIRFLKSSPNKIMYGENEFHSFWVFLGFGASIIITGFILLQVSKKRRKNLQFCDINDIKVSGIEIKKMTTINYILLSIPIVGSLYAMFRMQFLISEHFDATWNFLGRRFWKWWFSCISIMFVSLILSIPSYIVFYYITTLNNIILSTAFSLLIFVSWGYSTYFLTNYVIKKLSI